MTFTDGAQCTANFVYTDAAGTVYIGQAAHCSGTGGQTDTDGCQTQSLPNGTPVEVTGASQPGTLVYNSWTAMQAAGETDADTCAYNDFALIKLDPADYGKVNPSVPTLGGPTAPRRRRPRRSTTSTRTATPRCARASRCSRPSAARASAPRAAAGRTSSTPSRPASPATRAAASWTPGPRVRRPEHAPARPGRRPPTASRTCRKALAYARSHGGPDVTLANGTEPFTGSIIG